MRGWGWRSPRSSRRRQRSPSAALPKALRDSDTSPKRSVRPQPATATSALPWTSPLGGSQCISSEQAAAFLVMEVMEEGPGQETLRGTGRRAHSKYLRPLLCSAWSQHRSVCEIPLLGVSISAAEATAPLLAARGLPAFKLLFRERSCAGQSSHHQSCSRLLQAKCF